MWHSQAHAAGDSCCRGLGKACQGLSPVFKYQWQLARQMRVKEGNSNWKTPSLTLQATGFMASRDLFQQRASQERCSPRDARFLKPHLRQTVLKLWFTQMARGGGQGGKIETSVCEETETTVGRVWIFPLILASRGQCRALWGVFRLHPWGEKVPNG